MPEAVSFLLPLPPLFEMKEEPQLTIHLLRDTGDFPLPKSSCQSMGKMAGFCGGRGSEHMDLWWGSGGSLRGAGSSGGNCSLTSYPQLPFQDA